MTLIDLFFEKTQNLANDIAYYYLVDGENNVQKITFNELKEKAELFASFLLEKYPLQSRIVLLFDTGLDFVVSFWGTILAGMVAVPVQPPYNFQMLERLIHIGKNAESSVLITNNDFLKQIENFKAYLQELPEMEKISVEDILSKTNNYKKPNIDKNDNALIQYTSGSVGVSKGVLLSHHNILSDLKMPVAVLTKTKPERTEKDSCLCWLPLYHDMGLASGIVLSFLLNSYSVIMSPLIFLQKPFRWIKALSDYKTTVSAAPNFAFDVCSKKIKEEQLEGLDLSNWSITLNGAEPIRYETITNFSKKFAKAGFREKQFYPAYGLAESFVFVTGKGRNEEVRFLQVDKENLEKNIIILSEQEEKSVKIVSLGYSWGEQDLLIINPETLEILPENQVGEVVISSPSIAKGYWNMKEETERVFNIKLNTNDERYKDKSFLRTEDLGFLNEGYLYLTGRIKDLIIIRGNNYYPQHIEQTVEKSHSSFRLGNCSAFSIQEKGEEKLIVVQEIKKGIDNLNISELNDVVNKNVTEKHGISPYKIIFVKAESLPKTSSGKLQRRASKKMFLEGSFKPF
ncbi:MAG: fatty acyl-AMP ligase [Candidatus Sericytochromatia bacterium]